MQKQTIIFRTDAGASIGTGHLMRCFALARELIRNNVNVFFVTATRIPSLKSRLTKAGIHVKQISAEPGSSADAFATCSFAKSKSSRWIVVDGYVFKDDYEHLIKKEGFLLMIVDDFFHAEHNNADLILNQNAYAKKQLYRHTKLGSRLLLGTRYALLRDEFIVGNEQKKAIEATARNILVTLGGSDPQNNSHKIIQSLQQLPPDSYEARIVVGGCNPNYDDLAKLADSSCHRISLFRNVENMAKLYAWADLAITGGGSTTLELASMGVPMITVVIAENQVRVCHAFESANAAVNLGYLDTSNCSKIPALLQRIMSSRQERLELSQNAKKMVDGRGAERVAVFLYENPIQLRKAGPDDCKMVFRWANDPSVRAQSFNKREIGWDEHCKWFDSKLRDLNVLYFMAMNRREIPIGQVRFDIADQNAIISITIAPEYRGFNYGTLTIDHSVKNLFQLTDVKSVHAFIKKTNKYSYRAFKNAGFQCEGDVVKGTDAAYHLIIRRP